MRSDRTPLQHAMRAIVLSAAVLGPLVWPSAVPVTAAILGALLAYDGLNFRTLSAVTVLVVIAELISGMHAGIVSLPFITAALLLALAGRIFSVAPWAGTDGWQAGDLIRTVLVGTVLAAFIITGSVLVGSLVYGLGMVLVRIEIALDPRIMAATAIVVACTVIILRRIDVPLRRKIRFGM